MATYTLSGSGTRALSSGTVALHVTITTVPVNAGHGPANPPDYYGVGSIRPGNATAFWEPFTICGGPHWMPVPYGSTRLGYAFASGAVVSVDEVFWPAPLAYPLAFLPDVAAAAPANGDVLTYQSSTGHWINAAAPTGGGGGTTPAFDGARYVSTAGQSIPNNSFTVINFGTLQYDTSTRVTTGASWHYTVATGTAYLRVQAYAGLVQGTWTAAQGAQLGVFKNGTEYARLGAQFVGASVNQNMSPGGSTTVAVATNDTIDIRMYQNCGAARALSASALEVWCAITKVG